MTGPAQIDPRWRPALRPGVIVRHDPRRGTDLLVMPERVVLLNPTAAAILSVSNGRRSVDELIAACKARYTEGFVARDVVEFLAVVRAHGWLL